MNEKVDYALQELPPETKCFATASGLPVEHRLM